MHQVFLSLCESKQTTCVWTVWPLDSSCTICEHPPLLESDSNHMSHHPSVYISFSSLFSGAVSKSLTVWLLLVLWCLQKLALNPPKKLRKHLFFYFFLFRRETSPTFAAHGDISVQEDRQESVFRQVERWGFLVYCPPKEDQQYFTCWLCNVYDDDNVWKHADPFLNLWKGYIVLWNDGGCTSHQMAPV